MSPRDGMLNSSSEPSPRDSMFWQMPRRLPISSITVPTLIIHREDNPWWPVEGARWLAERIPNARLVELNRHFQVALRRLEVVLAEKEQLTQKLARANREATIPARRYGSAAEFGAMCAFLCSQHAGFIVGQNILLDGGATNATL